MNADIHNDGCSFGANMTTAKDVCRVSLRSVVVEYVLTDVVDASHTELYQFLFLSSRGLIYTGKFVIASVYITGVSEFNTQNF